MILKNLKVIFILIITWVSVSSFAADTTNYAGTQKGNFFAYWGWNWSWYTKSDIQFHGDQYDFTLADVVANDRPSPFSWYTYFNPARLSIPQYNFRFGYFFKDNLSLSVGIDHMKYVVEQLQTVQITGNIQTGQSPYDGIYSLDNMMIQEGFLKFEHTDGLNYINFELRKHHQLFSYKFIHLNISEGIGAGVLVPRTNTSLLYFDRYDEFHLAGYGLGAMFGAQIKFFKHFFIQSEFKTGFINMPDIRTTEFPEDRAQQHFFFSQLNILFGSSFKFH